jgi:nitrate reductase (NAD(P)H)
MVLLLCAAGLINLAHALPLPLAGGGRNVIRVEVSLDCGKTWRQAQISRFEEPNKAGKRWCWVHWTFNVQTAELARSAEIHLRAWDSAMNTQPALITWNLMGMMNNCHFRILISHYVDQEGKMHLRFQHPAPVQQGGLGAIGWREEENLARQGAADAVAAAAVSAPKAAAAVGGKLITMEEVEKHSTEESAWFVHEGKVRTGGGAGT